MVILGLVLVAIGALAIVCGVFTADITGGRLEIVGIDLSPMALFLVGVGSAVAIWWGLWVLKSGSKRSLARRREHKRLEELSTKLEAVEAERRMNVDDHEERDRPTL